MRRVIRRLPGLMRGVALPSHRGGFTLLEALIALLIMSIAFIALLRGAGLGLSNVAAATATEIAVSVAQSRLASFDVGSGQQAATLSGDDGQYHWELAIAPLLTIAVRPVGRDDPGPTTYYKLAVTVSWTVDGRHASLSLVTSRLSHVAATRS